MVFIGLKIYKGFLCFILDNNIGLSTHVLCVYNVTVLESDTVYDLRADYDDVIFSIYFTFPRTKTTHSSEIMIKHNIS